jgi:FkbM family methyltransferase
MKRGLFGGRVRDHSPGNNIVASDGTRFVRSSGGCRLITCVDEYFFEDIREDDIVLDIGANAGAFCIRAARKSRNVIAVEPVTTAILEKNIRLNGVSVRVIEGALGRGGTMDIEWDGAHAVVPTWPLGDLVGMACGCDFLKCDCEGGEWLIDPGDLAGIRRIEMELHVPPIGGPYNPGLLEYIGDNYEFTIDRDPSHLPLGVMGILHAIRRMETP